MAIQEGFNGNFCPQDTELLISQMVAIVRANRYMFNHVDYLIAVDCWDTPITSSDLYYIKQDITSRLSRYNNHEDVTDVWIWK